MVDHDETKQQQYAVEARAMWADHAPADTVIPVPRLARDGMLFEIDSAGRLPTPLTGSLTSWRASAGNSV